MAVFDELSIIELPPPSPRRRASRGFAINGRPPGGLIEIGDKVCVLAGLDSKSHRASAKQLRVAAPSELPSGRVPLYVCAECGDLGCGAVSVHVTQDAECFVWSELSYESPSGASPVTWLTREERDFYFARDAYLGVIY